jgi:hypothetical protein
MCSKGSPQTLMIVTISLRMFGMVLLVLLLVVHCLLGTSYKASMVGALSFYVYKPLRHIPEACLSLLACRGTSARAHTHTHTHTRARAHARTHTHILTHSSMSRSRACTPLLSCLLPYLKLSDSVGDSMWIEQSGLPHSEVVLLAVVARQRKATSLSAMFSFF